MRLECRLHPPPPTWWLYNLAMSPTLVKSVSPSLARSSAWHVTAFVPGLSPSLSPCFLPSPHTLLTYKSRGLHQITWTQPWFLPQKAWQQPPLANQRMSVSSQKDKVSLHYCTWIIEFQKHSGSSECRWFLHEGPGAGVYENINQSHQIFEDLLWARHCMAISLRALLKNHGMENFLSVAQPHQLPKSAFL